MYWFLKKGVTIEISFTFINSFSEIFLDWFGYDGIFDVVRTNEKRIHGRLSSFDSLNWTSERTT